MCLVDVTEAFRQVLVGPAGAPAILVLTHITFQSASIFPEGAAVVRHVKLVPPLDGSAAVPLPRNRQQTIGAGRFAGSSFFVRNYVDDGVLIRC